MNTWLYKQFHSVHHRLYVPYAFGALYNHPLEGFLLDTLSGAIAEAAAGMSTREAVVLFSISTLKTVDDHCGYRLPFDPLQFLTSNNADYHDIHHQVCAYYFARSSGDDRCLAHRHQIKLRTALLRALGRPPRDTHDAQRHGTSQGKTEEGAVTAPSLVHEQIDECELFGYAYLQCL